MKNRKDIRLGNLSLGNKISVRKTLVRVNMVKNDILDLGKLRSIGFSNSPGVNFTKVLQAAFTLTDPESAKKAA